MWRALFLALGVYCCIVGAECLAIDKAVLNKSLSEKPPGAGAQAAVENREVTPPPWAPWSLISTGAVVVLYSFSIPSRVKG